MERFCCNFPHPTKKSIAVERRLVFPDRPWVVLTNSEHPLVSQNGSDFSLSAWAGQELGREKQPVRWLKYQAQVRKSKHIQPGAQEQRFPHRSKLTAVLRMHPVFRLLVCVIPTPGADQPNCLENPFNHMRVPN